MDDMFGLMISWWGVDHAFDALSSSLFDTQ